MVSIKVGHRILYRADVPDYMIPAKGEVICVGNYEYVVENISRIFSGKPELVISVREED